MNRSVVWLAVWMPAVLFIDGCKSKSAGEAVEAANASPAEKAALAKAALLELMHAKPKVFEGADPAIFQGIALKPGDAPDRFQWGAFTIDTSRMNYHADVFHRESAWFYSGGFEVCSDGRWKALDPKTMHGHAPPGGGPPSDREKQSPPEQSP
jgi:hypothetical protein